MEVLGLERKGRSCLGFLKIDGGLIVWALERRRALNAMQPLTPEEGGVFTMAKLVVTMAKWT